MVDVRPTGGETRVHVGHLGLDELEFADALIEGFALMDVIEDDVTWSPLAGKSLYWASHSSVRSFARAAHSFACYALLASLTHAAALIRLLARSLPSSWESE